MEIILYFEFEIKGKNFIFLNVGKKKEENFTF
jgi:hypothetical protein